MTISIDIVDRSAQGQPPLVRLHDPENACTDPRTNKADAGLVGRTMLQSAAYLFTQGQPVEFGPEVPPEALK